MGADLAAGTGPALRRLGDKRHGTVEPDGEHIVALGQRAVGGAVLHVGAVAPDAGGDRLAVFGVRPDLARQRERSEEHTSELQSLMRISYAVFCLKKKKI